MHCHSINATSYGNFRVPNLNAWQFVVCRWGYVQTNWNDSDLLQLFRGCPYFKKLNQPEIRFKLAQIRLAQIVLLQRFVALIYYDAYLYTYICNPALMKYRYCCSVVTSIAQHSYGHWFPIARSKCSSRVDCFGNPSYAKFRCRPRNVRFIMPSAFLAYRPRCKTAPWLEQPRNIAALEVF